MARKRKEREAAAATLQVIVSAIVRGFQARRRFEKYRASIVVLQVDAGGGECVRLLPGAVVDAISKLLGVFVLSARPSFARSLFAR